VKRIQLENSFFEGLNNAYLFHGDGPTTLVDTGVSTPETREQLEDGLAEAGVDFAAIEQVLLTHFHADHAGLTGEIQAESGATVRCHAADAPLVEHDPDAEADMDASHERLFDEWGMPAAAQEQLLAFLDGDERLNGTGATVEPIAPGESVAAGDEQLEAMHLPGHTAGLTGYVRQGANGQELLSGDALLPEYTPNVGGADVRVDGALAQYLSTLDSVADAGFDRAHPGHRYPIEDPTARAREIIDHHRERTENVLAALAEHEPATPWRISAHLFGDLSNIHILHGPGEASAHLEHLRAHGIVERDGREYRRIETDPDTPALFP
jgi:glyoxylase-like metal-dependent hydrolase (beta-lactamase superfamily II)